jgi:hypothetical protein
MVHTTAIAFLKLLGKTCAKTLGSDSLLQRESNAFAIGATTPDKFFSISLQKDARRKVQ